MRWFWFLMLAASVRVGAADRAAAPILFGAAGTLRATFYNLDGSLRTKQVFPYVLAVSNTAWGLRVSQIPGGVTCHAYCDGSNVYLVEFPTSTQVPPAEIVRRYALQSSLVTNWQAKPLPCVLQPGSIILSDYIVNLPWLANLSAQTLHRAGLAGVPAPWELPRVNATAYCFLGEGTRYSDRLGLPKELRWHFSPARAKTAPFQAGLDRELMDAATRAASALDRPSGDPNYTVATYVVRQATSIAGCRIPEEYALTRTLPSRAKPAGEPILFLSLVGTQKVTGSPDLSLLKVPEVGRGFLVVDHRFRSETRLVDFIQYLTNDVTRASVLDRRLQAAYARKLAAAARDPARRRRWPLYCGLALALGLPLALLKWRELAGLKTITQTRRE